MDEIAAILANIVLCSLVVLQLSLVAGLPLGKLAWGGQHLILPAKLRVASLLSAFIYICFGLLILNQAAVLNLFDRNGWTQNAMIVLTVYFSIGVFVNSISRSKIERFVMSPVAAILAVLYLIVSF